MIGGVERRIEMAPEHHPYWLTAIGYAPPGVLIGAADDYAPLIEHRSIPGDDWTARWAAAGSGVSVEYEVDSDKFARMLAKIAHAFAIASLGIGAFETVLPPIILGNERRHAKYVGGFRPEDDNRAARAGVLHSIELSRKDEWAVVSLRLFAHLDGTPNYRIVAGRLR